MNIISKTPKVQKEHYYWIDIAKIVGIYLVTIGHGGLISEAGKQLVYSFHIPLFFIISGMLYKRRPITSALPKICKSIFIPYILISLILLAYNIILLILMHNFSLHDIYVRLGAIVLGLGYNVGGLIPVSTPMWFVVSLMFIMIVMSLSKSCITDLILCLVSIIGFCLLDCNNIDTYFPIDSSMMALPFFLLGFYVKDYVLKASNYTIIIAILMIPAWYLLCNLNGRVDINTCNYGNSLQLFYITGALGSFCVLFFCKLFQLELGGAKLLSSGTFVMMGFNLEAIYWVEKLWNVILPSQLITSIIGCFLALLIVVAFYPIIMLCKKNIPAIIGYR